MPIDIFYDKETILLILIPLCFLIILDISTKEFLFSVALYLKLLVMLET